MFMSMIIVFSVIHVHLLSLVFIVECKLSEQQEWIRSYRLGDGAKDGGASVYVLSRQQLQRWYYVDNIKNPTELQEKYRAECGVYADRANLVRWLKVLLIKQKRRSCMFIFVVGISYRF